MLKSMTGFGRADLFSNGIEVTVEIKAVNHRFFEFYCRIPRAYQFLEEKLKGLCQQSITRGKIELSVFIDDNSDDAYEVEVNHSYAKAYIDAIKLFSKEYGIKNDIKASAFISNPEIFKLRRKEIDESVITEAVLTATSQAIESFIKMRETEGERLKADIKSKAKEILNKVEFVEKESPETVKAYRERIEQKVKELLGDTTIDQQRIITETAIFADKVAVDEETVRLRSHIKQLDDLLEQQEPVGKKLDFIVQEMNREANTIGSKSQNLEIAHTVVEIKAAIEKIREQIQNIE